MKALMLVIALLGTIQSSQEPLKYVLRRNYQQHSTKVAKDFENITSVSLSYIDTLETLVEGAPGVLGTQPRRGEIGTCFTNGDIAISPAIRPDLPALFSATKMRGVATHEFGHLLARVNPDILERFDLEGKYIPDFMVLIVTGDSSFTIFDIQAELFADAFEQAVNKALPEANLTGRGEHPYQYYYFLNLVSDRQLALMDSLVLSQRARLK